MMLDLLQQLAEMGGAEMEDAIRLNCNIPADAKKQILVMQARLRKKTGHKWPLGMVVAFACNVACSEINGHLSAAHINPPAETNDPPPHKKPKT